MDSNIKGLTKIVHELHDIRNAIAHSCFEAHEDGIEFDYVSPTGDTRLPKSKAPKDMKAWRWEDFQAWGIITYSQFESYDAQLEELMVALNEIANLAKPITDIDAKLASDIEDAIRSSDNVIPFRQRRPRESDDDVPGR